ncbi:MAG TPA: dihydropteroate synthase [Polyangiaceae bacterium]|nr:dihydropteroate synthase [Polyangiaceae bacterium]
MSSRLEVFRRVLDRARATRGAALMGVCNVTPDSFSDGGRYLEPLAAKARVDELLAQGADIIDLGGESTRPGARPVPAGEQIARVLEVARYAASLGACTTIDTASPEVADAVLDAGACAVNDASCLRDGALAGVVAARGAGLVLMHARGTQEQMRGFSQYPDAGYGDVVRDVLQEWAAAAERARSSGVPREALVMDPGLGFAKNAGQSMVLLDRIGEIVRAVGLPVAVGASRKSFLALVDPDAGPADRLGASIAAAVHAVRRGAAVVRVHDVRATRQAIDLTRRLASDERPVGG